MRSFEDVEVVGVDVSDMVVCWGEGGECGVGWVGVFGGVGGDARGGGEERFGGAGGKGVDPKVGERGVAPLLFVVRDEE